LPAANALGQWPQASGKKVYPPSLEVLIASKESTLEKIDELIGYLYIICVPEFLKDAKVRPLLYTCTASLIMHYQEMQEKCGSTNSVGQKLGRSLCQANIVSTSAQANTKLFEWSQVIKNDYDQKNSLVQDCNDTTILQVVQAQSVMINNLAKSHFDLKAENRRLNNSVESLEITVKNQPKVIAESMAVAFMDLLVQRGLISTTTVVESPLVQRGLISTTTVVESPTSDETQAKTSPPNEDMVPSKDELNDIIKKIRRNLEELEKNNDQNALQWVDIPNDPNSNKHLTIRELLEEMIERSHVLLPRPDSLLENATLPPSVVTKNSGKFKCAMKLVQSVLTKEQKQMLALPKKSRQEIKDFPKIMKAQLYNIEKNAAEKMKELDQQSHSTTTTMLGLGNRYEQYLKKNKINEAPEANQQILSKYFSKS
jgi:hypothetical protein